MNRRDALAALVALGIVGNCRVARAQIPARPYRIGMLPDCEVIYCDWFHEAMRGVGWREGREYVVIQSGLRYGEQVDVAAERVVSARPDLVYTVGTQYILAARRQTSTIPIVMWASGYPVELGYAASLARPGGNVTGNTMYAGTGVWGKLLELLREAKPALRRVGILFSYVPPWNPPVESELVDRELREAARVLGLSAHIARLSRPEQLANAMGELAAAKPDAIVITTGQAVWPVRQEILRIALQHRWPTISDVLWPPQDALQPLLSYGPLPLVLMQQTAPYVMHILRDGAKPGDLPIQQPAKFELVVNLNVAKAIGLTLTQSLLIRADRVIE